MHNLVCFLRTGRFNGTVTTAATGGQPLAGATVIATLSPATTSNTGINSANVAYTALTDSNGNYEIDGVPPGQYNITATAREGLLNTYIQSDTKNSEVHGGDIRTFDFDINEPSVNASFLVTDSSDGNAINGAKVTLFLSTDTAEANPLYTATTNSSGTASLTGVQPGTYTVVVKDANYQTYDSSSPANSVWYTMEPSGYYPGVQNPTPAQIATYSGELMPFPVPITLVPVIPVYFYLTDASTGNPLAASTNYTVTINTTPTATTLTAAATPGDTTTANLPAATYTFSITASGYASYTGSIAISSAGYMLNGSTTSNPMPVQIALSANGVSSTAATIYGLVSSNSTWYWPDHGLIGIDPVRASLDW